jgi:K+-transporting ATPase ATPase C chain
MKNFGRALLRSAVLTAILAAGCCGLYPLAVYAAARLWFRPQADGSLIFAADGLTPVGSRLIGQNFAGERYFAPRPSAAGAGYDAANSGGTNYGPTSAKLAADLKTLITAYRRINGLAEGSKVPADAVTRSGSGLDPHISPANAALQAPRVARARHLPLGVVSAEITRATAPRDLDIFGEAGVNVLVLNVALDQLEAIRQP